MAIKVKRSFSVDVHVTRRFHLVRFIRAVTGDPDEKYPDPDDRGYVGPTFGPVIGMIEKKAVVVRLKRLSIDSAAPLFVTSSNKRILKVTSPAGGALPSGSVADIEITAGDGGNPRQAKLEVRFESLKGPVIHAMTVWVFQPLNVAITPHQVSISQIATVDPAVPSVAKIDAIMPLVRAIWAHQGVTFTVNPTMPGTIALMTSGEMDDSERPKILGLDWVPGSINVYMIPAITSSNPGFVTLGYGYSRPSALKNKMPNPGIILADGGAGGAIKRDTLWWANDLAHEIGHFFTLWHPENKQPPDEREDTWSRRMLMHNFNHLKNLGNWKDDVGYGEHNRGCLVTKKHLHQLVTDGETTTARGTIASGAGPY